MRWALPLAAGAGGFCVAIVSLAVVERLRRPLESRCIATTNTEPISASSALLDTWREDGGRAGQELPCEELEGQLQLPDLPDSLLVLISDILDNESLCRLSMTCRRLHAVSCDWSLWKRRFEREFFRMRKRTILGMDVEAFDWKAYYAQWLQSYNKAPNKLSWCLGQQQDSASDDGSRALEQGMCMTGSRLAALYPRWISVDHAAADRLLGELKGNERAFVRCIRDEEDGDLHWSVPDLSLEVLHGMRLLHIAAARGCLALCKMAVKMGADLDALSSWVDGERTAMHFAARNGCCTVIRFLFASGASLSTVDYHGQTALHWAVTNGHVAAAELLAKLGSDVNALTHANEHPLDLALILPHPTSDAMHAMLISLGAKYASRYLDGEERYATA